MKTNDALKQSRRRFLQAAGAAAAGLASAGLPPTARAAGETAVGGIARAKDFDAGTPIFGKPMTAAEVRRTLGVNS